MSRGLRLALPDSKRLEGRPEEGGHSLLGSSCGGVGRQAGKGHLQGGGRGGNYLKGAGLLCLSLVTCTMSSFHLLGIAHFPKRPTANLFLFPQKAKESSTEW